MAVLFALFLNKSMDTKHLVKVRKRKKYTKNNNKKNLTFDKWDLYCFPFYHKCQK